MAMNDQNIPGADGRPAGPSFTRLKVPEGWPVRSSAANERTQTGVPDEEATQLGGEVTQMGVQTPSRPDNEPHQLPIGTILSGRYAIGRVIGQGGFGITYFGRDLRLNMPVAVKEYYPSGVVNRYHAHSLELSTTSQDSSVLFTQGKGRFLDEARALARFADDPNVVYVRDFFEENNTAYIVMEFLEGQSLREYGDAMGPIPFDTVFQMLAPVMRALGKIHQQGLIHRDISPSNLFLLPDGRVKILDFGTARGINADGEKSLSVMLKPGFAPEEQYRTRGSQGGWTDVYALCASIYKLITGVIPENAMNRLFEDTLDKPSALGAKITPAQEDVLMHGLAIKAANRIQSMEELKAAFEAASVGRPVQFMTAPPQTAPSQPAASQNAPVQAEKAQAAKAQAAPAVPVPGQYAPAGSEKMTMPVTLGLEDLYPSGTAAPSYTPGTAAPSYTPGAAPQYMTDTTAGGQYMPGTEMPPVPGPEPHFNPEGQYPSGDMTPQKGKVPKVRAQKEKAPKTRGRNGRKRSPLPFILIGVAAVVVIGVILIVAMRKTLTNSSYKSYSKEEISSNDIASLNNPDTTTASFFDCTLDDAAIEELGSLENIKSLSLYRCTGFTTLAPLRYVESLQITGNGMNEAGMEVDGAWFTEDMSSLKTLYLINETLVTDLSFLEKLPAFAYLHLASVALPSGNQTFPDLPNMKGLYLSNTDTSRLDLTSVSRMSGLSDFEAENCGLTDISFLEGLENLYNVEIPENTVTTLEPLSASMNLSYIYANQNQLTNLAGLEDHAELKFADVSSNQLTDISALEGAGNLYKLNADRNQLADISVLESCTGLQYLSLSHNQLTDISALHACDKIKELNIDYNQVDTLEACENMIDMTGLSAVYNRLPNLKGLQNVTQLQNVYLSGNQLTDISELAKSQGKLDKVLLDDNQLTSLSAISGNPQISVLTIDNNPVGSLSVVKDNTTLKYLSASNADIQDVSPLAGCTGLAYLDLGENRIKNIDPLGTAGLSKMALLLQNNEITDISGLDGMKEYVYLSLYGNSIRDFSSLPAMSNISSVDKLYVSWQTDFNYKDIAESNFRMYIYLIDVPMDKRADIKNVHKEVHGSTIYEPEFISIEEADARIEEFRLEQRRTFGIAPEEETGEEASSDAAQDETAEAVTEDAAEAATEETAEE